jgi:sugar O-acyltransferase (sialic acid O-acetyltransferase NeuD family)
MSKQSIVIIGAGQQSNVVLYNIKEQGIYVACCILDINESLWGTYINGVYVEQNYNDYDVDFIKGISKKYDTKKFFIGLGNMKLRKNIFNFFISNEWESVNIIHPSSVVSTTAKLGRGVLIEAGCLVTSSPTIGNNVVINTGSQVNHDNVIEDHVYIASGVLLSGGVTIKENTLLDDGVIVTLGRTIGSNCIIGAGSVVTKDIRDNSVAFGLPCKIIRNNN